MQRPESAKKVCAACGRTFEWRRKWAKNWHAVRYCSAACRRAKRSARDLALEQSILDLLAQRRPGASICPSEAARSASPDDWRPLMPDVRRAAQRLWAQGEVEITQKGKVVDPSRVRGPVRIRRVR